MKLLSYMADGEGRVGALLDDDRVLDLRDVPGVELPADVAGDMMRLIEAGDGTWEALRQALSTIDGALLSERAVSIAGIEWLPPVRRPSKIVCVVTNNRALDAIKVRAPTDHPAFFIKPSSALIGHLQPIEIHKSYGLTHPEPELAVVIGKTIKGASEQEAAAAVFGYSIVNDVTSVGLREEDSVPIRLRHTPTRYGMVGPLA